MSTKYVRKELDARDRVTAVTAGVAVVAAVGVVTIYVARLFLARRAVTVSGDEESADAARR